MPNTQTEYKQPTKNDIAMKLSNSATGAQPDWEGFITWVNDQIDAAKTAGYNEGYADGLNGENEDE